MNRAYRSMPALWTRDATPDGFSWIDANDSSGNVLSFLRHGVDADGNPTVMACVANFSGSPKPDYRVGLPFAGRWREVLNTDAESYGGSGWGNYGGVDAEQYVWHGRPASAVLQLPPAGVLWLAPEPFEGAVRRSAAAPAAQAGAPPAPTPVVEEAAVTDSVPTAETPVEESVTDPALGTAVPVDEATDDEVSLTPAAAAVGAQQDEVQDTQAPTDSVHPPAADLESGPDPVTDAPAPVEPADDATVSIPADRDGARDEETVHIPAPAVEDDRETAAQPEATDTSEGSSDDGDEGPGTAQRSNTAQ
jgi:1,4-alpha-glucan branching enzyme